MVCLEACLACLKPSLFKYFACLVSTWTEQERAAHFVLIKLDIYTYSFHFYIIYDIICFKYGLIGPDTIRPVLKTLMNIMLFFFYHCLEQPFGYGHHLTTKISPWVSFLDNILMKWFFCYYSATDVIRRVCYSSELHDYFQGFFSGSTYLKPNRNCNLTSKVSGCEPGWACATSLTENVDMKDSKNMPARTEDCQPCCEGFFCPKGLTCMIRKYSQLLQMFFNIYKNICTSYLFIMFVIACPLGAYCPAATLDTDSGICKP